MEKKCAVKNMVWSIIGLSLASLGIPGLIICSIMKKNVKLYNENGGEPCAFNRVAGILSQIGLIIGIVMTVFWTLWILIVLGVLGITVYILIHSNQMGDFFNQIQNSLPALIGAFLI